MWIVNLEEEKIVGGFSTSVSTILFWKNLVGVVQFMIVNFKSMFLFLLDF